ncbi:MAG: M20/M25/M40 family metallo-hydrolase [Terriglobales bacterium]
MRTAKSFIFLLLILAMPAMAQNAIDRVTAEALKPSHLETNLERLTDQVGGRVPGTPAMQAAVQWGVDAFKAAGADQVHTEAFTIRAGWTEGNTEMTIVTPERFRVRAISRAWTPALAPAHHVPVIDVGQGTAEDFAKAKNAAGSILLIQSDEMRTWDDLDAEYSNARRVVDRAVKAKALAVAFQSTRPHGLLYRHSNAVEGEIDSIPSILLSREDAGRMVRLLASGQKLSADLSIPNHITGPVTSANVVAELRGSEKPDEFVVLGAHLDSWDLGTGALDNGCNAALVIDALRAIRDSGVRPRRSIRFILFSGEEEGLVGSFSYVRAHRGEMDKAAGVVVFDDGIGRLTGFSLAGRKDLVGAATRLLSRVSTVAGTGFTTDASTGTDNFDFMLEGVPTLVANQEEANYLINYHATSDTFDKVDLAALKKHVGEAAGVTFALAEAPERLGPRLNHEEVEQTLRETHLDEELKSSFLWQEWESGKRGREKQE